MPVPLAHQAFGDDASLNQMTRWPQDIAAPPSPMFWRMGDRELRSLARPLRLTPLSYVSALSQIRDGKVEVRRSR
jgi:hypothetical protein